MSRMSIRYQFGDQAGVPKGFVRLTLWGDDPYDYTRSYTIENDNMTDAIHKAKAKFINEVLALREKDQSRKKNK